MSSFMNHGVGYQGGAVNVMMYDWNKSFLPGDKIKICINSQLKLKNVSYYWDYGKRIPVKIFFNRYCRFKVRMPDVDGNKPILKIITEVQFSDGTCQDYEHTFEINNMH